MVKITPSERGKDVSFCITIPICKQVYALMSHSEQECTKASLLCRIIKRPVLSCDDKLQYLLWKNSVVQIQTQHNDHINQSRVDLTPIFCFNLREPL